jgi:hypothetical protein
VVAEGLELGNGPTRFSSLVAAQAMVVLPRRKPDAGLAGERLPRSDRV